VGVFKTHLLVVDTPTRLRASVFGRKVIFHLRTANEIIANDIRKLSFVREVRVVDNKLVVTLDEPETCNPEVVRSLVKAGADIQFVGELRHSLEDVYLQLVKSV
jgi:ABC-2 type transport system ATP-binding protein